MNAKKKWLAVVSVIAAVCCFGWLILRDQSSEVSGRLDQSVEEQIDNPVEEVVSPTADEYKNIKQLIANAKSEKLSSSVGPIDFSQQFFEAENAMEALAAIEELELAGQTEEAQLLKGWLVDTCPPGLSKHAVAVPEQQWVSEWMSSYCGDYESSEADLIDRLAWGQHQIESRANQIMQAMQGMDLQGQTNYLLRLIENARSWLDLEAIKYTIHSSYTQARATNQWSDIAVHSFGQSPQYQGDQARDIQATAIALLQCIEFIDCGSDSLYTIGICYTQPFCQQGWSLYDFFYQTHSPLETDQIFLVLQNFVDLRRRSWRM